MSKHFVAKIIEETREQSKHGKLLREIAESMGYEYAQIRQMIKRENRKQREGELAPKRRGRPPMEVTTKQASAVHFILCNEKYPGKMILQKYYTVGHMSKKTLKSNGERFWYTVIKAHEVIIPMAEFERMQEEMKRRQEYFLPDDTLAKQSYPFSVSVK